MPIELDKAGQIATLTLNRPEKLNALTVDMLLQMEQHLLSLSRDAGIRVLLIKGAGDRSFCVGADIHAWADLDAVAMWRNWITEGHRIFDVLARLRVPTIAVLNGYTFGGGLELALATDIRIAATHVQLALPEVQLGIVPGWGGTERLPALSGASRAKQMVFTGMRVQAEQAASWGLINEVVDADVLEERAQAMAATICNNGPLAVQMTKQLIDGGQAGNAGFQLEALASGFARFTADAIEGVASFKEKRPPVFKGQ